MSINFMTTKMLSLSDQVTEPESMIRYGCVFCRTGREEAVARSLEGQRQDLFATPVYQVKHKSVQGVKSTEVHILLPGYVYFRTKRNDPPDPMYVEDAIRVLEHSGRKWQLIGQEAWFAQWIFENHGVIGLSKACRDEEGKTKIIEGPLKTLEAHIIKYDKRSRGCQIELDFCRGKACMWLAFEWVA